MLGAVVRSHLLGRNVMKNFVRNGSHGGVPGENLPFDIHNRTKLTVNFFLFIRDVPIQGRLDSSSSLVVINLAKKQMSKQQ
ncbi:unnamed protein product [Leptosia nina]|uniref:Uncharacterized protein n=1 Tax=Leptosia nina TaxID=320188 RepID=A0AAV1JIT0_9NEOP